MVSFMWIKTVILFVISNTQLNTSHTESIGKHLLKKKNDIKLFYNQPRLIHSPSFSASLHSCLLSYSLPPHEVVLECSLFYSLPLPTHFILVYVSAQLTSHLPAFCILMSSFFVRTHNAYFFRICSRLISSPRLVLCQKESYFKEGKFLYFPCCQAHTHWTLHRQIYVCKAEHSWEAGI